MNDRADAKDVKKPTFDTHRHSQTVVFYTIRRGWWGYNTHIYTEKNLTRGEKKKKEINELGFSSGRL